MLFQVIGHGEQADGLPVQRQEDRRLGFPAENPGFGFQVLDRDPVLEQKTAVPDHDLPIIDHGFDALPLDHGEALRGQERDRLGLELPDEGFAQGVLRSQLGRTGVGQELGPVIAGLDEDIGHLRLALGQGAGLVENDRVEPVGRLQAFPALDQDAALGALLRSDHDRRWSG